MITGVVTSDREVVFRLAVGRPGGARQEVDAVLDTGSTDFLTLPTPLIEALGEPRLGSTPVTLAGGSEVLLDIYQVHVDWDGGPRRIQALAAQGDTLIGMSLLYGSRVKLDVVDGGSATIEPLP